MFETFDIATLLQWGKVSVALLTFLIILNMGFKQTKRCICFIGKDEQLMVEDLTETRAINGPKTVFLSPFHKSSFVKKVISLGPLEYAVVCNTLTGEQRVEEGPTLLFLDPYDIVKKQAQAFSLGATEFIRLLDKQTGKVRVEIGEQGRVIPTAYEELFGCTGVSKATSLKYYQYVKIEDEKTGVIRVVRGEQLVFLGPYERITTSVLNAQEIDDETAVLIRNKHTGQQRLVTEKQIFFPTADEEILEVQHRIKLADYEGCIVRGKDGTDSFKFGKNPEDRTFFLQPHSQLVELTWCRGRRREQRSLKVKIFDLRPMFMSFEFNCRTADNVELILEGTFFWQLADLETMLKVTADTTGDVCNHARSRFIERVAKVTLQEFMANFNLIAEAIYKEDDKFYSQRGVLIHSLEVSGYKCAEKSTALILEQIIQETTNRMNRLQSQDSENEVRIAQIKGDIAEEKAKCELLQVQITNSNTRSSTEGEAEALKIKGFLQGFKEDVPDLQQRIELWKILRKTDALKEVCANGSKMYYTPNDVNLSIEDRTN